MNLPKVLLKFISWTFEVAALKRIKKQTFKKAIKEIQSLIELSRVLLKFVTETFSK